MKTTTKFLIGTPYGTMPCEDAAEAARNVAQFPQHTLIGLQDIREWEAGDRVVAEIHRGGGYDENSIHTGGGRVTKAGVISKVDGYVSFIEFDDGDSQSVSRFVDHSTVGWPVYSVTPA